MTVVDAGDLRSPFPFNVTNYETGDEQTVVDDLCACGALRSQHNHTLAWGHGDCPATECGKFTWVEWVMEGDA